jgi:hypothetical protein
MNPVQYSHRLSELTPIKRERRQYMGQAKNKQREGFSPQLIQEWESEDCVNFAVALARLTGWLLHVDWFSSVPDESALEDSFKPLRVYVADNREGVFDVRGVKSIEDFYQTTIIKLSKKHATTYGGVRTRFYAEARLAALPLRAQPDEHKIVLAMEAIKANRAFLNAIPAKPASRIPVHDAARYTFGRCVAYAEAMRELIGLQPAAILVQQFKPIYANTKHSADGYVHSISIHPDGTGEDAWGIAPIEDIAARFGAVEFDISQDVHREVVGNYLRNSNELYQAELAIARKLVAQYRVEQESDSSAEAN